MADLLFQRCINPACGGTADWADTAFRCPRCGGLLDVAYDWNRLPVPSSLKHFESKWASRSNPLDFSGVWRFRELLPFAPDDKIVTIGEGQTLCQRADAVAAYCGMSPGRLFLQYEGMNPSGSFKDNGMSAAFTHARMTGATRAACASTGNTSASLAAYCAATQLMRGIIFIGSGKISYGKLSQALEHGALTVQIQGDFDDALRRVQEVSRQLGIYLVNSVNPFRLEGQKTIMFRVLEALRWEVPDWVVVPGGNLGNVSAFAKAFFELRELGLIARLPRLAVINAEGAHTAYQLHERLGLRWNGGAFDAAGVSGYYGELDATNRKPDTLASAIEINRPVNLPKALRALDCCNGVVRAVPDAQILDAKAKVGAGGLGCEPASGASVAGLRHLVAEGVIERDASVVCILTGHVLKDSDETVAYHSADPATFEAKLGKRGVKSVSFANRAVQVPNDLGAIVAAIQSQC
ncbi:Threonine synthase [Gemmata obscuriglobus]|uniref:Threonine synthase n=1 Tax=Gemmata obscuriglobus TaxID=114 RepID=A0A2Z3GVZ4_9BACT|nr:threonine synthase [Gemmata obscuriglobus]AWM37488.1 threonine synthase [Gemmata obscuriglobus]QEG29743.1 Threonine synthase [Gemmata obscuriglobus]VTS09060.1 threonine synthase : Threonine synthase OS=Rhodopirellula sallentina SM41 GN=RSSM_02985 PE=4 SV=1: PALP [Gemmata obscuriglobus UQM 2246]